MCQSGVGLQTLKSAVHRRRHLRIVVVYGKNVRIRLPSPSRLRGSGWYYLRRWGGNPIEPANNGKHCKHCSHVAVFLWIEHFVLACLRGFLFLGRELTLLSGLWKLRIAAWAPRSQTGHVEVLEPKHDTVIQKSYFLAGETFTRGQIQRSTTRNSTQMVWRSIRRCGQCCDSVLPISAS